MENREGFTLVGLMGQGSRTRRQNVLHMVNLWLVLEVALERPGLLAQTNVTSSSFTIDRLRLITLANFGYKRSSEGLWCKSRN